jgi:type II secretory pathway predicted ATPase ExeA
MFEEFFHLRENPFALAPNPRFIFNSHEHGEALAHLRYWVENGEGFVLITGEVGTGKTTALFDLLAQLPTDYAIAFVSNSTLTIPELLEEICRRFGLEVPPAATKPALLGLLERFLLARVDRGLGSLLILDEAQNFESDALEEIRLLSNLERVDGKLIQIALVGQPELERKLARPELRQLRQRIGIRYRLGPLSEEETLCYLHHRVAVAGGDAAAVFSPDSAQAIHRLTHGIPREINIVASQALINAFVAGASRVLPEHVQAVVDEFAWSSIFGEEIPPPRVRLPRPPARGPAPPAVPPTPAAAPALRPAETPPVAMGAQAGAGAAAGVPVAAAPGPAAAGPESDRVRRPALGVVKGGSGERVRSEPVPAAEPPAAVIAPPKRAVAAGGGPETPGPRREAAAIRGDSTPPPRARPPAPRQAVLFDPPTDEPWRRVPVVLLVVLVLCAAAAGFFIWQWARGSRTSTAGSPPVEVARGAPAAEPRVPGAKIRDQASSPAPGREEAAEAPGAEEGDAAGRSSDPVAAEPGAPEAVGTAVPEAEPEPEPPPAAGNYRIQAESFIDGDRLTIETAREAWTSRTGVAVEIVAADVEGDVWQRVLIGRYATPDDARAALVAFQEAGTVRDDAMVVRR